jgi:hypothetical protein
LIGEPIHIQCGGTIALNVTFIPGTNYRARVVLRPDCELHARLLITIMHNRVAEREVWDHAIDKQESITILNLNCA